MVLRLLLLSLLIPGAAQAEPVRAAYVAYARGLNVLTLSAEFTVAELNYRVRLNYRTAGTVGTLFPGESETIVTGRFVAGLPVPERFDSRGRFRGEQRVTLIEYPAGDPVVRTLTPPPEAEREPVPDALQPRTVDTVSVMAQLIRQVASTGRCDGTARTFDGRRLSEISAHTVGMETLEASGRSSFAGPALRCDFQGRQLAGFRRDADPKAVRQPQIGTAWFAPVVPGGTPIPVRVTFNAPVFGAATLYLTGTEPPGG